MASGVRGRVSVVVPCFNAARWIRDAIDSVLAQTYDDVELVVADDGSTDESPAVVRSYGGRLRYLRQENAGPSAARNLALRAATGEYVALLDADDRFHPTKLARQLAAFAERPDAGAVYCGWRLVDGEGIELPERGWPRTDGDLVDRLVLGNLFHPVAVVLRRAPVDAAGGFDERLPVNEDWDLFLRIGRRGARWAFVDEALCDYRIHAGQSHERLDLVHGHAQRILERFFDDPGLPPDVRRLESAAFEAADLRAAAEHYAAGSTAAGRAAMRRAAARRPALLGDAAAMARFLRMLLPDGHRRREELVRRRVELLDTLHVALRDAADGLQGRVRAWKTLATLRARLAWRGTVG